MEQAKPYLPDVIYCGSAYEAAEGADAVVIATEWEEFRALDLDRLRCLMVRPVIVDLRNIYRADEMKRPTSATLQSVGRRRSDTRKPQCHGAAKRPTRRQSRHSPRLCNANLVLPYPSAGFLAAFATILTDCENQFCKV